MNDLPKEQYKEFAEEYSKTIEIPEEKGKQFLLCPVGIVGAGKTTVVKPLAEKFGLVRISSDEMRKMLKEKGFSYKGVQEMALIVVRDFIIKGYGVAIDADCSKPERRKEIENFSAKTSIPLIWIHINPPEEFILNKLRNYKHTWLFKDADEAIGNYEFRKPLHQNLDFNFTYTFDTSKSNLSDQIEEAYQIIKSAI
ncbi:MAG: AAA family ATPase [Candidatus Pacebacteria bacterium]|nr:AAA family ATPase [Candidatus Paceibacterota bacterium]